MIAEKKKNIKINSSLTRMIIKLHQQGYQEDFHVSRFSGGLCLQEEREELIERYRISLVGLGFDQLTSGYKYIHAIETCCGHKGILLCSSVLFNCNVPFGL